MSPLAQPKQRQQEAEKAPSGQGSQKEEIRHHGPQRQEDEVIPQKVECKSREQHRRSKCQHIVGLLGRLELLSMPSVQTQHEIGPVYEHKAHVKERPQVLGVDVPMKS